jgi:hypothetical protein
VAADIFEKSRNAPVRSFIIGILHDTPGWVPAFLSPVGFLFVIGIANPSVDIVPSGKSGPKWSQTVLSCESGNDSCGRSVGRGSSFLLWGEPGLRWF